MTKTQRDSISPSAPEKAQSGGNEQTVHLVGEPETWAKPPLWKRMWTAWLVLVISLLGTAVAWQNAALQSETAARAAFDLECQRIKAAITHRLDTYQVILHGGRGLFTASKSVQREEWRDYLKSFEVERRYPAVRALGCIERVELSRRKSHIEQIHRSGFPAYTIWPVGERAESYPIVYVESFHVQEPFTLGYDAFTEPARRAAMERARDMESLTITGKVAPPPVIPSRGGAADVPEPSAFLMYAPIYRKDQPTNTVEERRAALRGFLFAAFHPATLMEKILGQESLDIRFQCFDGDKTQTRSLFYDSAAPARSAERESPPLFAARTVIQMGGRPWSLVFSTLPAFERKLDQITPMLVLAGGLAGSFLLFGIVWSLTSRAHALELAGAMTAEVRLRDRAITASHDGIIITDSTHPDDPIVYVNPGFERITGYPAKDVIGKNARFLQGTECDQPALQELRAALREKRACRVTLRNYRKDGALFWNELSISPIRDERGRLTHFIGIQNDVTDRRKTEEAMRHVQKLESLGVLAGGIAHDFNNLLAVILGNADLALNDSSLNASTRNYLEQVESASHRGAELCRQMLAYSGKGRFVIQRVNLNTLVREMTHLLEVSISKKAVLKYHFADNLPSVEVDATQIRQVIMNLVVNASDAIGEKSGVITITTGAMRADRAYLNEIFLAPELPEGDYAYIEVADTGCGMDAETRSRIFDPFFTTKFTGRGLGLAAVLGIARGHGGVIKVYSEPGRGSTFKFLLPCAPAGEEKTAGPVLPQENWRGSGTILVVDDEEDIRTIAARMAQTMGFQTLLAADGREAVSVFQKQSKKISLVLLDMTMPHMNGEETFREIHRLQPQTRVILMSGYNEEEAGARFAGKGLAGFIQKPFKLNDLRARIQSVLENRAA
ncbi:MAG: CHASE domain-containing protein [Verrucomicrobia bacterium]|nr:CHASE domain-containing protein [Verrucomicrobiota bacterium]